MDTDVWRGMVCHAMEGDVYHGNMKGDVMPLGMEVGDQARVECINVCAKNLFFYFSFQKEKLNGNEYL